MTMSKYRIYLIFGASGSGKGTQGRTLGTLPCFFHCACGDVFRSIDTRTSLGKAFHEYSSKGQLVPDEITVELCGCEFRTSCPRISSSPTLTTSCSTASRAAFVRPR